MQTVSPADRVRNALWVLPALLAGALLRFWMLKKLLRGHRGRVDLWGDREESPAFGALCADGGHRRDVSDADPAAGVPAVSGGVFQAVWNGKLCRRGVGADCPGTGGLPAAGGFCKTGCAGATEGGRGVLHAVAGGIVSVYGDLCGEPSDGGANAVCDRAGDVERSEVCGAAGMAGGIGIHVCGDVCGAAAAGWSAGGGGVRAGAAAGRSSQEGSDSGAWRSHADGLGLHAAGGDAVSRLGRGATGARFT